MEYTYRDRDEVKLDCKTARIICDIKDAVALLQEKIDQLNEKVDSIARES